MKWTKKKSTKKENVSAMILKVAEGYLDMGETVEEKANYLRSSCTAWNIASMPPSKQEKDLKAYIKQYKKINNADKEDCKALEEDMRQLIKKKKELYPDINNIQIVDSKVKRIDGRDHVSIASMKIK